ncbi:hypothetical protein FOMPIDRAFT_16843, partial [Fomitopsis schrenkii]
MKSSLPIWYHLGATRKLRRLNNTRTSDCLRTNHNVLVVADVLRITNRHCYRRERVSQNDYTPDDCTCRECTEDRRNGCKHPWRCCKEAEKILKEVHPKWHPHITSPRDGLSLTKRRTDINEDALAEGGTLTFNPSLTQSGNLDEAFRVLVDPEVHKEPPA